MRLAIVAVIAVVAGCGGGPQAKQPASQDATPPAESSASAALKPRTQPSSHVEGDRIVMPVTFPDGTMAELVFPPELGLHRARVEPYSWGELRVRSRAVQRDFVIFRAGEGWTDALADAKPIAAYEGQDGAAVAFYDGAAVGVDYVDYLVFRFGSWTVAVYDYGTESELAPARMTEEERAVWASSFIGSETPDGFLVLDAEPPLFLAPLYDGWPPVSLALGSETSSVELQPFNCNPDAVNDRDAADGYAIWCLPEASMIVVAGGKRRFVRAVLDGLEIRNVRPAA